jgi:iodotyrosine deiodinase
VPAEMIPYSRPDVSEGAMHRHADSILGDLQTRRSCRSFSDRTVDREIIRKIIAIANTAPSGANRQPWRFVAIDDPEIKREIRLAAEEEERISYSERMPQQWLDALEPIGTDAHKPFLDIAPWLVVIFRVDWEIVECVRYKNYYPIESIGLAAGMFLMAAHQVGLSTLTHTPSPMRFLRNILNRPKNEKPFLLIPVGFPAADCVVPDLPKKSVDDVTQWNR